MTSFLGTPATAPGPLGPQMLRHTPAIVRDAPGFLATMRDTYGDVVQFPIPRPPTYLVASAAGTQQVLVRRPGGYDKDTIQYRSLSLVTGDGLLVARNEQWRDQRPVVQPAFHHRFLPHVARVTDDATRGLIHRWRRVPDGAVVDVEPAMMDLTLQVVGECLFGDDLVGTTAELADATLTALDVVVRRARLPLPIPQTWPTPANRRLATATASLEAAVQRLMDSRVPDPDSPLLLDLLLTAGWTRREVRDQIVTFLVAGHETAASALTWALGLLAQSPEQQSSGAEHARACADETLRLYPPAWVITRSVVRDDTIDGREIPAGALVIVSPYLVQRDPRWWSDPDEFRPSRFAGALGREQREAYLPFGAGLRQCIGRDFALWEMTRVLTELSDHFRWEPALPLPRTNASVTLRPQGGMQVRIRQLSDRR
mgnify:CR=1 FL=1